MVRRLWAMLLGSSVVLAARVWPGRPAVRGDYPVVFIVGCPRSGTSWLHEMFLVHPDVVGSGESHAYSRVHAATSSDGVAPVRWARFFDRYLRVRDRGSVGLHHYVGLRTLWNDSRVAIGCGRSREEVARLLVTNIFDSFHASQGRPTATLVEKTPWHVSWGEVILHDFPRAKVVEIVRDGRDVCTSMSRLPPGNDWAPRDRREQIREWRKLVEAGNSLHALPQAAGRVRRVRYDELSGSLSQKMGEIFDFCGLAATPEILSEVQAESTIDRFKASGRGHHVRTGKVGGWRADLTPEDLRIIDEEAGDLLAQLGFDTGGAGKP